MSDEVKEHKVKKGRPARQLSITDICFAAGFNSLRRFNEAIKSAYNCTPRELKNTKQSSSNSNLLPFKTSRF